MSFYKTKTAPTLLKIIRKMGAIKTLKSRNNKRIIEKKFIRTVLKEESQNIKKAQDKIFGRLNTPTIIRSSRSFTINNQTLTHRHSIRQRFDDMKFTKKFGKQKPTHAHNKIIWGHYNNIIFKLAYGLTQDVKNQIANELNIHL